MSHARRRAVGLVPHVAVLAAAVLLVVPVPWLQATAQERSLSELERDLGRTDGRLGELDAGLADLRDELSEAEIALAGIEVRLEDARARLQAAEGQVALGEAALAEARDQQRVAEEDHQRAVDRLEVVESELDAEEALLWDQVVHAFKYGTVGAQRGAMVLEVMRRADDPNAFAVGMKQLQTVVDVQDATVTRVTELRARQVRLAEAAASARAVATQAAEDAAETLRVLEDLQAEAAAIAEEVAREEAAQQALIHELRADEAQLASLRSRLSDERQRLSDELAAERARIEAEQRRQASAGSGQGRLGLPGADGGPDVAGIVCPVRGAVAGRDFSNDWGYPRSGGRYHQGNDIFASRGTPVVAVGDGTVVRWNPPSAPTSLGGITLTYRTADGSEWYNAHLDSVADGVSPGSSVSRGQVIGTVGNTGNARTTPPHLHLGRRHGGSWVNPWPTISPVC